MPTTRNPDYPDDEIPPSTADDLHVQITEDEHNAQASKDWEDPVYMSLIADSMA